MMKRILTATALTVLLAGCGSSSPGDAPAEALETGMSALAEGDYETFCKLISPADLEKFKSAGKDCVSSTAESMKDEEEDTKNISVDGSQVQVTGDTATVPAKAISFEENGEEKQSEEDIKMTRIDGTWYLTRT